MNLSIYSEDQQQEAMERAIAKFQAPHEHGGPSVQVLIDRFALTGINPRGLIAFLSAEGAFWNDNILPDEDGSDVRSVCEGLLLGVMFTLELQELQEDT